MKLYKNKKYLVFLPGIPSERVKEVRKALEDLNLCVLTIMTLPGIEQAQFFEIEN